MFLVASGVSTAGSFAGITAKGWILMDGSSQPFVLALNFAALSLPTPLISGLAGVRTDRVGCERVLVQAQWALTARPWAPWRSTAGGHRPGAAAAGQHAAGGHRRGL